MTERIAQIDLKIKTVKVNNFCIFAMCNDVMKILLTHIFVIMIAFSVKSQDSSKVYMQGGYGFYECINAGVGYYFNDNCNTGFMFGYDNFSVKDQETYAITLYFNHAVFYNRNNGCKKIRYYLNGKSILWQLTDDYYIWRVISIVPSARCGFEINRRIELLLDMGPSFNIVLHNERKTFKEVGWPYHVMPNASVSLNIRI